MHPLKKEFAQLYEKSGWTQAEVARQLELTRGGVNGIITGPTVPSLATVKLFKLILTPSGAESKAGQGTPKKESWAEPLLAELRKLSAGGRRRMVLALLEVVRAGGGEKSGAKAASK